MTAFTPPLEFGNRAFRAHASGDGSVIVIDSPPMGEESAGGEEMSA